MRTPHASATYSAPTEVLMNRHAKLSPLPSFARRFTLGAVAVGAIIVSVIAVERPAAAQVVEIAPPAVRVEAIAPAPAPHLFWTGGYWGWQGGRHVWVGGRWEHSRPGLAYERAHWGRAGRAWRFSPGRWHRR